jgi:thiamine-phosphate diphosphorylase
MNRLASHFYAMVDPASGHPPVELARIFLDCGVKLMQLRQKQLSTRALLETAAAIARMCEDRNATLIVNDRPDVAYLARAHGVHLGQHDLPLAAARRLLGPDMTIGVSTSNLEQALTAQREGADYIGFGPLFAGGVKRNQTGRGLAALRALRAALDIPIVAIGGITEASVPEVLEAGADAVAIISDVVFAPDIGAKVRALLERGRSV